ncbi:MAG: hypothetical protein COY39_03325 [Alphaproteobacteria bacterium CG_4_10_14_0_8_um_filter_37_21]|nr:MAG: hypothetical protein COY39_03325 [Alphaproteobacteria bacterium CG_4_10_14_0_8_um_filter_37_21]
MLRKISTWFNSNHDQNYAHQADIPQYKYCDYQGCNKEGIHKAPKTAQQVANHHDTSQWYMFCLDHVREYNASWRFYNGMTQGQAQQSAYADQHWNRETWPMGTNASVTAAYMADPSMYQDPFSIFTQNQGPNTIRLTQEELESLNILKLSYPYTSDQLQSAYRTFVKRNHPDLKKTKDSEDNIRAINNACQVLKNLLEREIAC